MVIIMAAIVIAETVGPIANIVGIGMAGLVGVTMVLPVAGIIDTTGIAATKQGVC